MGWNAIFEAVFSMLYNDPQLVPGILGPRTPTNLRTYRAWPQLQSMLSTYEPQPPEGWLVIEEGQASPRTEQTQRTTNHEFADIVFHIFGTQYSLTHDTLDVLDEYFHFEIDQQRDLVFGNRIVLFTRRMSQEDKYAQDVKLFEKVVRYSLEMVRDVALYP